MGVTDFGIPGGGTIFGPSGIPRRGGLLPPTPLGVNPVVPGGATPGGRLSLTPPTPPPGGVIGGVPPVPTDTGGGGIGGFLGGLLQNENIRAALGNLLSNLNPFTPPAQHGPEPSLIPTPSVPTVGNTGIGVPGGTSLTASNPLLAAALGSGRSSRSSRRQLAELLIATGGLDGIATQPIIYQSSDPSAGVKYGSYPGNVIVRFNFGGQQHVRQMPKMFARALGLYRPRKKPVISVRDSNAIRRANSAKKRVKKLASDAGYTCATKGSRRRSSTPTRRRRR